MLHSGHGSLYVGTDNHISQNGLGSPKVENKITWLLRSPWTYCINLTWFCLSWHHSVCYEIVFYGFRCRIKEQQRYGRLKFGLKKMKITNNPLKVNKQSQMHIFHLHSFTYCLYETAISQYHKILLFRYSSSHKWCHFNICVSKDL